MLLATLPLTEDQSAQLSSARGHYDALVRAQAEQGCGGAAGYGDGGASSAAVGNWKRYAPANSGWKHNPGDFPPM
ncbi:hypothetical protein [Salipiger abyssi]|uniref:hypothetical protein n=1 Tax=Salipiger abyssi TaxID=1250539 RepID=UPI001A8CEE14|nr:hypothetical protein [Salipiger abyssi]MBN9890048.1 hypothetical protein [Salipiger abyssi]